MLCTKSEIILQQLRWPFTNSVILGLEGYDKGESKDNYILIESHPSTLGELGNLEPGSDVLPSPSTINISPQKKLDTKLFAKQELIFIGLQEDNLVQSPHTGTPFRSSQPRKARVTYCVQQIQFDCALPCVWELLNCSSCKLVPDLVHYLELWNILYNST